MKKWIVFIACVVALSVFIFKTPDVQPGQVWLYESDKNPFDQWYSTNTVIAVSNGYVLYKTVYDNVHGEVIHSGSVGGFTLLKTKVK